MRSRGYAPNEARSLRGALAVAASMVLTVSSLTEGALAQIKPEPMPSAYWFPLPADQINTWIKRQDTASIRARAWTLWEAVNGLSSQSYLGAQLPIWDTWWSDQQVQHPVRGLLSMRPSRPFHRPRQLEFGELDSHKTSKGISMSSGLDVASFDKFNDAYAQFLWTPHKGPGDRSYNYDSCRDLLALNAKWSPGTKTPERKIEPFPSDAVSLKLAFQVVKAPKNTMPGCSYAVCDGMTILPVWKGDLLSGPSNTQNSAKPKITEWNFCILVDPTDVNVGKHRDDVPCYGNRVNRVPVISLKAFYHFKADKETAVKIGAEENDFVVLVAMHISTREIDNWTWQTFWWSNGVHSYGQPPDYKRRSNNRPRSAA